LLRVLRQATRTPIARDTAIECSSSEVAGHPPAPSRHIAPATQCREGAALSETGTPPHGAASLGRLVRRTPVRRGRPYARGGGRRHIGVPRVRSTRTRVASGTVSASVKRTWKYGRAGLRGEEHVARHAGEGERHRLASRDRERRRRERQRRCGIHRLLRRRGSGRAAVRARSPAAAEEQRDLGERDGPGAESVSRRDAPRVARTVPV
jgi:hypothetical protein